MYDRASESWWQQFEGEAIIGVRMGERLERVPARLESITQFASRHPEGLVLVPNKQFRRNYGQNPYVGYDTASKPFLYSGDYTGPGTPLMRVVSIEGVDEAWSLDLLRREREIRSGDLVISWRAGQNSALDSAIIAGGWDVGTVLVERISETGVREDVPYDVPFAFAFNAFRPDAPIRHID